MISLDNIYLIIKEFHPLFHLNHKKWHNDGLILCKNLLKKYKYNSDLYDIANIFAIQFYINNFNEEHTKINISFPFDLKFAGFFVTFSNNLLIVNKSFDKRIKIGQSIIKINNVDFIDYINDFILFNGGNKNDVMDQKIQANYIFIDNKNPFLLKPKNITFDNNVSINLKYSPLNLNLNDFFYIDFITLPYNIYKNNNHIFLKIDSFNTINYNDLIKLLPNTNEITVDLSNNLGGLLEKVEEFFNIVYNINIQIGIFMKYNKFNLDINEINKIKNIINKPIYCKKNILEINKNKLKDKPKLNIIVNDFSKSASKHFVKIAIDFIPDCSVTGPYIDTENLCGTPIILETPLFKIEIPTNCFSISECKKKIDYNDNRW